MIQTGYLYFQDGAVKVVTMKKKPSLTNGSAVVNKRPPSCKDVIRRSLSKLHEIDAVFLLPDDANTFHVFTVVRDFKAKLYDGLLKKERAIEKKFPEIAFEFHVRAHQGRTPAQAVPFEAELVYSR